jgi:hypothetical protein
MERKNAKTHPKRTPPGYPEELQMLEEYSYTSPTLSMQIAIALNVNRPERITLLSRGHRVGRGEDYVAPSDQDEPGIAILFGLFVKDGGS